MHAGATLIELMVAMSGTLLLGAMTAPLFRGGEDERALGGAARYLATLLHRQRAEAIAHAVSTAVKFQSSTAGVRYAAFADGNGNGVRTADINQGTDPQVSPWETITDRYPGVTFGIAPNVVDMDSGDALTGTPVRIGGSDLLSFSPVGTASSGTLYLRGRHDQQFAVRVLGVTGRVRLMRFDPHTRSWVTP